MNNILIRFSLKLFFIICVSFGIHLLVLNTLEYQLLENKIILSYSINTGLAIGIFAVLFFLKEKFKTQLGFLFMVGSAMKFAVYFIVFYPVYKFDNDVTILEFSTFFIPYLICLFFETYSLAKWLNNLK